MNESLLTALLHKIQQYVKYTTCTHVEYERKKKKITLKYAHNQKKNVTKTVQTRTAQYSTINTKDLHKSLIT